MTATITDKEIEEILHSVDSSAIKIGWKSEDPLPGVGERRSKFRGPGAEFVEFDTFEDGDDTRHINWTMTARSTDDTVWKTVFQEEKEVSCVVLAKVGYSMDFGTERATKRHVVAETTAAIFFALDKTRDRGGCIVFSRDAVLEDMLPKAAMRNLHPALEAILEADPYKPTSIEQKGDGLSKALSGLPLHKSLVFVISDFLDMSETDWLELGNAACFHDVICICVQDKRERELPPLPGLFGKLGGFYVLQDHDGKSRVIWNNAPSRRKYAANFRRHEAGINAALDDCMCQPITVSTEEGEAAISRILDLFSGHS